VSAKPDPTAALTDLECHERIEALVRAQLGDAPGFVWEVKTEYCREGLLVMGRASRAALDLYYSLLPSERWFVIHLREVESG
jgi:hypothetical protein